MLPPTDFFVTNLDGTPVLAQENTLPGLLGTIGLSYVVARLYRPHWSRLAQLVLAAIWFGAFELSYVLHTLGHIQSARQIGAPMDSVLLAWGLQSNVYHNEDVTARQHVGRAAGGPIVTSLLVATAMPFYALLRRVPLLKELSEIWLFCNAFNLGVALMPIPHFDAASILKWTTAQRSGEVALGDEAVQKAGSLAIAGLFGAASLLVLRGQWRAAIGSLIGASIAIADLFALKGRLPG